MIPVEQPVAAGEPVAGRHQIGLGDVFEASAGDWLSIEGKAVSAWIKKVRGDAVAAMNEHSLAGVVKRMKKTK